MAKRRRLQPEQSKALILQATARVITEEGSAALSVRRVAKEAGIYPSLVHYYFETTEALLLAFFREQAARHVRLIDEALAAERPLKALWDVKTRAPSGLMTLEIMSLGHRYESLRRELGAHLQVVRKALSQALADVLARRGDAALGSSPEAAAFMLLAAAGALVADRGIGLTAGHAKVSQLTLAWISELEPAE